MLQYTNWTPHEQCSSISGRCERTLCPQGAPVLAGTSSLAPSIGLPTLHVTLLLALKLVRKLHVGTAVHYTIRNLWTGLKIQKCIKAIYLMNWDNLVALYFVWCNDVSFMESYGPPCNTSKTRDIPGIPLFFLKKRTDLNNIILHILPVIYVFYKEWEKRSSEQGGLQSRNRHKRDSREIGAKSRQGVNMGKIMVVIPPQA